MIDVAGVDVKMTNVDVDGVIICVIGTIVQRNDQVGDVIGWTGMCLKFENSLMKTLA